MSRNDLFVLGLWCTAVLALLFPVWSVPGAVFFNYGDLFTYHIPLRELTASELQAGRLPFWNPYILLGVPHLANPQTALFYPAALASSIFPVSTALVWDTTFHVLWAGAGMFLLARAHRIGRIGAFALASGFALSPFLVYRVTAGIPTLLAALSWVPWLWLAWLGGAVEILAATFALQLLSGHGQFLVMNGAAMTLWGICSARRGVLMRRLSVAGGTALALTSVQWVLSQQYLAQSVRGHWTGAASLAYALFPTALWTWLHPGALGTPLDGQWKDVISVYFETCGGWIGPVCLAGAVYGLARSRHRWPAAMLAVLGVVLGFGPRGPITRMVLRFPILSYLRTPSRWLFLTLWGALLLAGMGIKILQDRKWPRGARAGVLVAAFLPLAVWDFQFLRPQEAAPFLAANRHLVESFAGRSQRVLTDPELANQNKTILYRMMNVNGYDAFYPKDIPSWAADAEGAVAADASRVFISNWRSQWLERAGVRVRLSSQGVQERDAWPLATFRDALGARLKPDPYLWIDSPGRWKLTGPIPVAATAVALALPLYPGWHARLNGRDADVLTWDRLFQVLPLASYGETRVYLDLTMDFRPTAWPFLVAFTLAAWLMWSLSLLRRVQGAP